MSELQPCRRMSCGHCTCCPHAKSSHYHYPSSHIGPEEMGCNLCDECPGYGNEQNDDADRYDFGANQYDVMGDR